jgi:hypothetical protein
MAGLQATLLWQAAKLDAQPAGAGAPSGTAGSRSGSSSCAAASRSDATSKFQLLMPRTYASCAGQANTRFNRHVDGPSGNIRRNAPAAVSRRAIMQSSITALSRCMRTSGKPTPFGFFRLPYKIHQSVGLAVCLPGTHTIHSSVHPCVCSLPSVRPSVHIFVTPSTAKRNRREPVPFRCASRSQPCRARCTKRILVCLTVTAPLRRRHRAPSRSA